jgi:hypothetical protein
VRSKDTKKKKVGERRKDRRKERGDSERGRRKDDADKKGKGFFKKMFWG